MISAKEGPGPSLFRRLVVGIAVAAALVTGFLLLQPYFSALVAFDNPEAQGAPSRAVVRVSAPEGEPYRIEWGSGLLPPIETGTIDPKLGYRDHTVNTRAVDPSGGIHMTVYAGTGDPYPFGDPSEEIGAVLFASGEYATCSRAKQSVKLDWAPGSENRNLIDLLRKKVECGSYRSRIP
ncbi:hypothetical protein GBA65_02325 [Rubrobacter marinus]|uniref:Uncharacterized protein n=1 Tax=Rubrobacter marinus TaxID=2653852 RepID=A0A6G8PTX2_9ACTN|nr:hypothetical protein [Rubrobacter marinus]QIN77532.1 hypothetical protein GBA65_02325 [Rubrobacter marinus]